MAEFIFADSIALLLLISGVAHILMPRFVESWLSRPAVVRSVGAVLLVLAAICLRWRGWYFLTLGALLAASGVWRLGFPAHSISAQRRAYPRWVHGCLLLCGAALVWALRP